MRYHSPGSNEIMKKGDDKGKRGIIEDEKRY